MINAIHGIIKPSVTLKSLGTPLFHYKANAPTATTDTVGCNTIDTTGTTTCVRLNNFFQDALHLPFLKANSCVISGGALQFTGSQYSEVLNNNSIKFRTLLMLLDTTTAAGGTFMRVASLSSGQSDSNLFFGNLTGALDGETIVAPTGYNSPITYLATDAALPTGYNVIALTISELDTTSAAIYINDGTPKNLLGGAVQSYTANLRFRLGTDFVGNGSRLIAGVKEVVGYSSVLTSAQVAQGIALMGQ